MSGSLFHELWDMLGDVLAYFGDLFGWVWDSFEEKPQKCRKVEIFKNAREYFSRIGALKISIVTLFPAQTHRTNQFELLMILGKEFYC